VRFFEEIPEDLIEAARIDGANPFQTFWMVVLPLAKPAIATIALFYIVFHWNEFFRPLLYLNDQNKWPLQLVLRQFVVEGDKLSIVGLEDMGKLVVAAIRGYCIGGGLQLALACDFRLCAADAVLGLGATRHGLIPDGAVLRLARIVGLGRAKELALLNDHLTPAQGLAMGLVNWVASEEAFEAELGRVIEKCLEAAPTAARHTKRLLLASFNADPRALIDDVVAAQMECMRSWELAEANRSWDEGRDARFFPPPARSRP